MGRIRTIQGLPHTGNVISLFGGSNGTVVGTESASGFIATCDDAISIGKPYYDHPCTILSRSSGGILTSCDGTLFGLRDCPVGWGRYPGVLTMPLDPPVDTTRVLSQSGPLTPDIYLPTAIFELKDIPKMLEHAWYLLRKLKAPQRGLDPVQEAAAATLAYQFGWKPLYQDMMKVIKFADNVDKRVRILKKTNTTGMKRRVNLGKITKVEHGVEVLHSTYGIVITSDFTTEMSCKKWATVHWSVRNDYFKQEATWKEAFRVTMGLKPGHVPIAVWKAMPWSWCIDWFTNLSQTLEAGYNSLYYSPTNLNIISRATSRKVYAPSKEGNFGGITNTTTLLSRFTDHDPRPALTLRVPFLDSYKLSILGSLAVTRGKPRGTA